MVKTLPTETEKNRHDTDKIHKTTLVVTSKRFQKYRMRCCINAAVVERAKYEKPGKTLGDILRQTVDTKN